MLNKLAEIIRDTSYQRLALAVVVSALLHWLLIGKFDFALPSLNNEMHLIEARIQMPKVVVKQAEAITQQAVENIIEKATEPTPEVEPKPVEAPDTKPPTQQVAEPTTPIDMPVEPAQPNAPATSTDVVENVTTQNNQAEQLVDADLVINENAYQYVETQFDVRTEIDGAAQGKATIIFDTVPSELYQLKWLTEPSGVAALFIGDLLQTSEGELTQKGLRPKTYHYQFGKKADKTRTANFDWAAKKISMLTSKGEKIEDLPEGAQDTLSFMYQFMYVAPLQNMQLNLTNGKRMRVYDYNFAGEETITSALGELKTMHIVHSGLAEEEKTELWLAIDYQFVPVKIRKTESDNKIYELLVTRINTNRPVLENN